MPTLLTAAVVVGASLAACSGQRSPGGTVSTLSVTTPADDAIVTGPGVQVSAKVDGNPAAVRAWVGDKGTDLRKNGSTWSGSLRRGAPLKPGANTITVKADGGSGPVATVMRHVYLLGKAGDLGLTVANTTADGGQAVKIGLGQSVAQVQATVNGQAVDTSLSSSKRSQTLSLGAHDGMHVGSNAVGVTAVMTDGTYQRADTSIEVAQGSPVASAGKDVLTRTGVPQQLDGSASRTGAKNAPLAYRWEITQAPEGSRPTLSDATSARPTIVPDRPGTYVVRNEVTQPGAPAAADSASLVATDSTPPIGSLLQTQLASANGIARDGQLVVWQPQNAPAVPASLPKGQTGAVQAIFDKQTLQLLRVDTAAGTPTGGAALLSALTTAQSSTQLGVIVVVSSPSGLGGAPNIWWEPLVQALGVDDPAKPEQWDRNILLGHPFSIVSMLGGSQTQGAPSQAWRSSFNGTQAAPGPDVLGANLTGYLGLSDNGAGPFTYIPNSYLHFDSSAASTATTNTMELGWCGSYPPAGSSCTQLASPPITTCPSSAPTGGFQVAVFHATTLQQVANQSFTTNSGCGAAGTDGDAAAIASMAQTLGTYSGGDGTTNYLVMVQSIGAPRPPTSTLDASWSQLASAVSALGGTGSVLAGLGWGSGYTLVGANDLARAGADVPYGRETSGDAPSLHPSARLSGVLARNHRNDQAPLIAISGGQLPSNFSAQAYAAPTPWPVPCVDGATGPTACAPGTSPAGQQAALGYITNVAAPNYNAELFTVNSTNDGLCYQPSNVSFRATYCNTAIGQGEWDGISSFFCNAGGHVHCQGLDVPRNHTGYNFTAADWKAVVLQLQKETTDLSTMKGLFNNYIQAASLLANGGTTGFDLQTLVSNIVGEIHASETSESHVISFIVDAIAGVAGIVWAVAGGVEALLVSAIAGVISELATVAGAGVNTFDHNGNGAPALISRVQTTMQDVVSDLQAHYSEVPARIGFLSEIVVTDWGKLDAVSHGPGSGDSTHWNKATGAMETSALAWANPVVLSSVFRPTQLRRWTVHDQNCLYQQGCPYGGDAANYSCNYYQSNVAQPYLPYAATEQMQYLATPAGAPPTRYVLAGPENPSDNQTFNPPTSPVQPLLPPKSRLTNMLAPVTGYGDQTHLGIFKPHLHEQVFGLNNAPEALCRIDLGSPAFPALAASASAPGAANVFYFTNQSPPTVTNIYSGGGRWNGPGPMPGKPDGNSPIAATGNNVFFVQGGKLMQDIYVQGQGWQGPTQRPGNPDGGTGLAAASPSPGVVSVFFRQHGKLVTDTSTNGAWQGPTQIPGNPDDGSSIAALSAQPGDLHVFYVQDGKLNNSWSSGGQPWGGPGGLPGKPDKHTPLAAVSDQPGNMFLFFVQGGALENDWYFPPAPWNGSAPLVAKPDAGSGIAATSPRAGEINVYSVVNRALVQDYFASAWNEAPVLFPR